MTLRRGAEFSISDKDAKYVLLANKIKDVNMDCSEIAEDFIEDFGGITLLFLPKVLGNNSKVSMTKQDGSVDSFLYHYAWVSDESLVYDPMLGYKAIPILDYLESINLSSRDASLELVKRSRLKCYI